MRRYAGVVMMAAAAFLAGCGAQEGADGLSADLDSKLEQIERETGGPVWWLGSSFEGLPLTHGEGSQSPLAPGPSTERARGVPGPPPTPERGPFFGYGECNGEGNGDSFHCKGPQVQLQHWPIASPSRYPEYFSCTRTTIRGVPAAQFDGFEIYIGRALIRIYAPNQAQARRAAAALRPLDGSAAPTEPLPRPAIDVSEALQRCAVDSLEGQLDALRKHVEIPLFWAGRQFEELPLFRAEGDGRLARFMYGECKTPEVAGSCYPALTVEVAAVADRSPGGWRAVRSGSMKCDRLRIRSAEAAFLGSAGELYVFTGPVTVVLRGPDFSLLRRAADALYPFEGRATAAQLAPPSDELRDELQRICPARDG